MKDLKLVLSNRTFAGILLSSLFNGLGGALFNIVFIVYAQSFPHSQLYISFAEVIVLVPIVLGAVTGYLADRTRRKAAAMTATAWLQAVAYLLFAWIIAGERTLTTFLLVGAIKFTCDLIGGYRGGLRMPILKKNLKPEDLNTAFGQLQGLNSVTSVIAQTAGVTLLTLTSYDYRLTGLASAGLYLFSGLALFLFRRYLTYDSQRADKSFRLGLKPMLHQVRSIFSKDSGSSFVPLVLSVLMINFVFAGLGPMADLGMVQFNRFGLSYGYAITMLDIVLTVGLLLGSFIMRDGLTKVSLQSLLRVVFVFVVVFFALLPLVGVMATVVLPPAAYFIAKVDPRVNSLVIENVPTENLGKVSGGLSTLFSLVTPFGGSLFVLLVNLTSAAITSYLIAGLCAVFLLVLLWLRRGAQPLPDQATGQ